MKLTCHVFSAVLIAITTGAAAGAHAHSNNAAVVRDDGSDPFASVYIVTSTEIYKSDLQSIVGNGKSIGMRDSSGTALVLAEIKEHQIDEISRTIHEKRNRCGGFFAFPSRAEAEAFVRGDQSGKAASAKLVTYTIDNQSTVNPWLPQVSETNIRSTITTLSANQNRYYTSTPGRTSAEWIRTTWQNLAAGRSDVTTELFTACSNCSTQPSVILTINGVELPNEILVVGAHLDSINGSGGGSNTQVAPGADDDASGIATLTEVIRIALASGWKPKRTVKFMGYAAEEVGLRGSNAIAQSFKTAAKDVVGMIQFDMTNYKVGAVADMQLISDYSNAAMKTFLTNLFDTYLAPTGLTRSTYTCGYGCSDHASWTSAGYPAAMMFEAGSSSGYNPNIHTANDTLANMSSSATHSVKFVKLGLAFIGELGKTTGTTPTNQAPVANFSFSASNLTASFTDSSIDADGTIASRSWNFGDGGTSTATNPSRTYAAAGTYTVTLTVTDNLGATHAKSSAVTVTTISGTVLTNGVARTGLGAAAGASLNFTMVVPAGATALKFVSSGGTGDADLYAKFGSAPTTTSFDCKSEGGTNAETCTITTAQAGTYHVLLKAYSTFSGASLTGSFTPGGGGGGTQTYSNAADVTIADNTTVNSPIAVTGRTGNAPTNASVTVAIVHTYQGDLKVDLVAPDGTLYNIHNRTGGGTDNINKTVTLNLSSEALNGTWNLRVNDNGAGDVGKIDSWSITF